jgi:hypothetical protein
MTGPVVVVTSEATTEEAIEGDRVTITTVEVVVAVEGETF